MTDALQAKTVSTNALPVIDISRLRSGDAAVRAGVGRDLRAACLDKGFLYLTGHGVPAGLRAEVFDEVENFFSLPVAEKMKADKVQSFANRGYEPLGGQTLEPGQPADLKEGYYVGRDLAMNDPRVVARKFNHGPNIWPEGRPSFRDVMERYFLVMQDLARLTMRGIALSLDLEEDHFEAFCDEELATVRLLHYPPQPANPAPGEKGCGAHTDFGTLTFLMQDDCGGLQVWDEEAGWIHAPPIPDTYVVNLGDMMARWTNDKYHSTLHRVVNFSGRERYSVPFFYLGHPDMPVECIHTCLDDGEVAKYPPTTVVRHIEDMYNLTYAPANG
ncbi:MAG: isopenicillin N synthase family oxygenase [Proteobacteria bacterium]|nr:isopenicillin N synthase family oxygenase [Pseudomonadota bacterium]